MKTTKQEKLNQKRIDAAFSARCSGIQVHIMDLGKIVKAGQAAIDAGATDQQLGDAIAAFVGTIRRN